MTDVVGVVSIMLGSVMLAATLDSGNFYSYEQMEYFFSSTHFVMYLLAQVDNSLNLNIV